MAWRKRLPTATGMLDRSLEPSMNDEVSDRGQN
jgi:hypothetical protein